MDFTQGVPADLASKLPENEVVARTLAQLDRMFGEVARLSMIVHHTFTAGRQGVSFL
jgi:hypothetical protein